MSTKTFIVTGGYGVIGRAIATGIASASSSHSVVIVCRDEAKAAKTCAAIRAASSNRAVSYMLCDLSSYKAVQNLAARWGDKPLFCLCNNAAAAAPDVWTANEEGIEMQFAVNVLGYTRMMDSFAHALRRHGGGARIVNVASYWASGLDLSDLNFQRRTYDKDAVYQQTKQANRMLTVKYAELLSPIAVNCTHSGDCVSQLSSSVGWGGYQSAEEGAASPLRLCLDDVSELGTGRYYRDGVAKRCKFGERITDIGALYGRCQAFDASASGPRLKPLEAAAGRRANGDALETPRTLVTVEELRQLLTGPSLWVCVWATAEWCVPCKRVLPGWSSFARADGKRYHEFAGRVIFAVADLTEEATDALSEALRITTLPTFVLFQDGKEVGRAEGAAHKRPARRLHEMLRIIDMPRRWSPAPLVTERLRLREFGVLDVPRVAEICGDERVARMCRVVPHPYSVKDAEFFVANVCGDPTNVVLAVELMQHEAEPLVIGCVSLDDISQDARGVRCGTLGYWISAGFWCKGYATEAASALLRAAFGTGRFQSVESGYWAENTASARVQQKLGFERTGAPTWMRCLARGCDLEQVHTVLRAAGPIGV